VTRCSTVHRSRSQSSLPQFVAEPMRHGDLCSPATLARSSPRVQTCRPTCASAKAFRLAWRDGYGYSIYGSAVLGAMRFSGG
jgi:hypothetical protein